MASAFFVHCLDEADLMQLDLFSTPARFCLRPSAKDQGIT